MLTKMYINAINAIPLDEMGLTRFMIQHCIIFANHVL